MTTMKTGPSINNALSGCLTRTSDNLTRSSAVATIPSSQSPPQASRKGGTPQTPAIKPKQPQYTPMSMSLDGHDSRSPSPVTKPCDTPYKAPKPQASKATPPHNPTTVLTKTPNQQPQLIPRTASMSKLTSPFKSPLKRTTPTQQSPPPPQRTDASPSTAATPSTEPIPPPNSNTSTISLTLKIRDIRKDIANLTQANGILRLTEPQPPTASATPPAASPATTGPITIDELSQVWLTAARTTAEYIYPVMQAKFAEQGGFEAVQREWAAKRADGQHGSSDDESEGGELFTMRGMLDMLGVDSQVLGWTEHGADGEGHWVG